MYSYTLKQFVVNLDGQIVDYISRALHRFRKIDVFKAEFQCFVLSKDGSKLDDVYPYEVSSSLTPHVNTCIYSVAIFISHFEAIKRN